MCRERRSTKHRRTKKNGEHIMANISRRNFMKVAAGAAGIAGLGLLNGCSKTEAPASSAAASAAGSAAEGTTTPAAAAPATDKLYTASINPQLDESEFRSNTKELTTLFSPLTIGSMEISNRMVKSAAGSATYLAGLTDELLTYYVNLAKGGVALIYVETIAALEVPEGGSYDADTLAFGQKLVDECHKYGAKMGYQMSGFGMGENDMTIDDIHAKQAHFVEVAKGLQQMGFDCVELNCAGFNMPAHFLSRFHNTRTDEYGIGSIENRARFITEIIEGVKKECGPDFNMQILINCIEENDNISNNPTMMTLDSAVTTAHPGHDHGRRHCRRQAVRAGRLRLYAPASGTPGPPRCPVRCRPVLHPERHRGLHRFRHPVRLQQELAGHADRQHQRLRHRPERCRRV